MKKINAYILILFCGLFQAQKMAYVDTQHILKQLPQYQQAESRLDEQVKKWQQEILNQQSKLEKLKLSYESEKILLTENQQKTKLGELDSLESNLNTFIEKKFGANGEVVTLRYNFAKPLQDQIWNAVNTISSKEKYNIVLNKSSDLIMIYADSKYDITDKVLKQLGIEASKKDTVTKGKDKEQKTTSSEKKRIEQQSNKEDKHIEQSKTGYGSKYVPKKNKNAGDKSAGFVEERLSEEEVIPQVEDQQEKIEDKKETGEKASEKEKKEVKKETKTTSKQPKAGYGSKYVPKKQRNKEEQTDNK